MNDYRNQLIRAGVKNLHEFGYPNASEWNILTDMIYSEMFKSMLHSNKGFGTGIDQAIDGLLGEIAANAK